MSKTISKWVIVDDCEYFIAKCPRCGRVEDSRLIWKFRKCPDCKSILITKKQSREVR